MEFLLNPRDGRGQTVAAPPAFAYRNQRAVAYHSAQHPSQFSLRDLNAYSPMDFGSAGFVLTPEILDVKFPCAAFHAHTVISPLISRGSSRSRAARSFWPCCFKMRICFSN